MTEQTKQQIAEASVILACFFYLTRFLGHQISELQGKVWSRTIKKLETYEAWTRELCGMGALDTLFLLYFWEKPIVELARMLQVSEYTLVKIFDEIGLPRLSSAEATRRYQKSLSPEEIKESVKRLNAALNPKQRSERMGKYNASLTSEQRRERAMKAALASKASRTPQQCREDGKKAWLALTSDERSEIMRKRWTAIPLARRREHMKRARAALTPEYRREMGMRLNASLSPERKKQRAIKARLLAELSPNGIETYIISILQELGIYAETASTAQTGQVYYTEHKKENKRYVRLRNGKTVFPDFKVKGQKRVIEVYGNYWHSQAVCEAKGELEYKWNPRKMIEEYAAVGYEALIIWEKDLKDPQQTDALKKALSYFSVGNREYHGLLKAT